jgi:long-chain acyl-CoA synthetase
MVGYWNLPEASAQTLSADNWLRTGDAGFMDVDGYVYIQDRIKDMIISGGENVYSVEVENVVAQHPAVLQCAVIGVPDDTWGEQVHAVVVKRPGADVQPQEIIAFCKDRIAGYKCPRSVDVRESLLPLSGAGKILKRELRRPFWEDRDRHIA